MKRAIDYLKSEGLTLRDLEAISAKDDRTAEEERVLAEYERLANIARQELEEAAKQVVDRSNAAVENSSRVKTEAMTEFRKRIKEVLEKHGE